MEPNNILLGSIDQSTTATKFIVYNKNGDLIASKVKNHTQITIQSGWLEHDPNEIMNNLYEIISDCVKELKQKVFNPL